MQNQKMISVGLLTTFLILSTSGCEGEKQDIDICLFRKADLTFYCANEKTGKKWELTVDDSASNKMVCSPYGQYIAFQKEYVCKKKDKK